MSEKRQSKGITKGKVYNCASRQKFAQRLIVSDTKPLTEPRFSDSGK